MRGQSNCDGTWNFHVVRHVCPNCKRKGLTLAWNRTWYCMYTKLGCGKIFDFHDKSVRNSNQSFFKMYSEINK
jgi:ribosomal protein L37AE/L43A